MMLDIRISSSDQSDPGTWITLEELLSVSRDVTMRAFAWQHQDFSVYQKLADGRIRGRGLPGVKWTFRGLRELQRELLRGFCVSASERVYIRTPTNETVDGVRVLKDYLCIMNWVQRPEMVGLEVVEMVEMEFTHCLEVIHESSS